MVKNKVAPPFRTAEFDMMHKDGISYEGDVLDLALAKRLIIKSGAWFRYGDFQIGQGREKTRQYMIEHPEFVEELRQLLVADNGTEAPVEQPADAEGDDDDFDPSAYENGGEKK